MTGPRWRRGNLKKTELLSLIKAADKNTQFVSSSSWVNLASEALKLELVTTDKVSGLCSGDASESASASESESDSESDQVVPGAKADMLPQTQAQQTSALHGRFKGVGVAAAPETATQSVTKQTSALNGRFKGVDSVAAPAVTQPAPAGGSSGHRTPQGLAAATQGATRSPLSGRLRSDSPSGEPPHSSGTSGRHAMTHGSPATHTAALDEIGRQQTSDMRDAALKRAAINTGMLLELTGVLTTKMFEATCAHMDHAWAVESRGMSDQLGMLLNNRLSLLDCEYEGPGDEDYDPTA